MSEGRFTDEGRYLPEGTMLASEVEQGMFLTGLDNGYVHSEPEENAFSGTVTIEFHDANGDEGSLKVPMDMPLMASRTSR